ERDRFMSALAQLNGHGTGPYKDFPNVHTEAGKPEAHGNYGFLAWHRAFLLDLERELQRKDASIALPYWKFDEVARNVFSTAFMGFTPRGSSKMATFDPSNPIDGWTTVRQGILRSPDFDQMTQPPIVLSEKQTLQLGDPGGLFANFSGSGQIEFDPHGDAHGHFRGDIGVIGTAARDPLFFLLHCNVDRLWAKWQKVNRRFDVTSTSTYPFLGSAKSPGATRVGHNLQDDMWPWNGVTGTGGNQRPPTAPGGPLPDSPVSTAPGPKPTVRSMIDYQGVLNPANRLGFGYDDVEFVF
ncbi:MAG: tyrosinase, partial [Chloroflexia bacterium]|nr:tyrosinase [Chloroflexia bacterium]